MYVGLLPVCLYVRTFHCITYIAFLHSLLFDYLMNRDMDFEFLLIESNLTSAFILQLEHDMAMT